MTTIPPVTVEAEESAPALKNTDFVLYPAEQVEDNDLLWWRKQAWRVKSHRASERQPAVMFVLWPVNGGRPEPTVFFNRQWIPWYREAR